MADDLTTLKNSLSDRANALGAYVKALKADSARSDEGFRTALDVCEVYTRAFVTQLESDWQQAGHRRDERKDSLKSLLESFLMRERWIDQRFARGAQRDVPRALKTIARREFRRHRLDGQEPVLTVGPPDSFETHQTSLADFLFADIQVSLDTQLQDIRSRGALLSIFSVPYIEGTRVLWYPIVLGHEIAHTRLDRGEGGRARSRLVSELLRSPITTGLEYSAVVDAELATDPADEDDGSEPMADAAMRRRELHRQVLNWTTELLCDLNAVRLFGPAGLSAIAEFLAILEFQADEQTLDMRTHPPLWVRLKLLFTALCQTGWRCDQAETCPDCVAFDERYPDAGDRRELPAFASVWRAQAEGPMTTLDPKAQFCVAMVTAPEAINAMIALVREWDQDTYLATGRATAIEHVRDELLDGIPGATHVPVRGHWQPVTVTDVVNAAWAARRILDHQGAGTAASREGVLLNCELSPHEKRLRLDSLASKAIDSLELSRLMGDDGGIISPDLIDRRSALPPDPSQGSTAAPSGGVLSRRIITKHLERDRRTAARHRLAVTPLSHNTVQDAAIDLRLGPDFIVFRHSATSAFIPSGKDEQDPRMMQERVHKSWGEHFILHPQELVLAATLEYIVLPDNVAAQVLTRSSYGRLGLLTATAVQVQPGSRGCITLELVNQGETPIELAPAARVAQLMMWHVEDACPVEHGKYWFPVGPEFSKVSYDPDRRLLQELAAAAEAPAAPPVPDMRVRFVGGGSMTDRFYELAADFSARDAIAAQGRSRDDSQVAGLILGVLLPISRLATLILRWSQGNSRGLSVTRDREDIVLTVDEHLPPRVVQFLRSEGDLIKRLELPPDDADDIADAIRRLMP
jgi:deoxycytidine triphosphate deaminase